MMMKNLLTLIVILLSGMGSFAQEKTAVTATPELLAILNEAETALPQDNLNHKVFGLFRMLNIETRFADKSKAHETLEKLLVLAPALPEVQQYQLYEGIAAVYVHLQQLDEAAKILDNIKDGSRRSEAQLNTAVLTEAKAADAENKTLTALLRSAAAGAENSKNTANEILAKTFLAKQLASADKDAAAEAFAQARKAAQKLEEVEEQNFLGFIIAGQVDAGFIQEALASFQDTADAGVKARLIGTCAAALLKNGKMPEAEKLLEEIPAGSSKDQLLVGIANQNISTLTDEVLNRLVTMVSTPERKIQFTQSLVSALLSRNRDDAAKKLCADLPENKDILAALQLKPVRGLLADKKFDEAEKIAATIDDARLKQQAQRQIAFTKYWETHDEKMKAEIEATYSEEEKKLIAEWDEQIKKMSEAPADDQVQILLQLMTNEFQIANISGISRILGIIESVAAKEKDPAKIVSYRLLLVRLNADLNDTKAVADNITKATDVLAGVKDIMELKSLVPPKQQDNPIAAPENGAPAVKMTLPTEKADVENHLFQLYLMMAGALPKDKKAGETDLCKEIFAKAKRFAEGVSDPQRKADMLFYLAVFLTR